MPRMTKAELEIVKALMMARSRLLRAKATCDLRAELDYVCGAMHWLVTASYRVNRLEESLSTKERVEV